MRYYACYEYVPTEVAVFNSKEDRDKWVNFQDDFSKMFPEIREDNVRIPLTFKEARSLVGKKILDIGTYIDDAILDNVRWVLSCKI